MSLLGGMILPSRGRRRQNQANGGRQVTWGGELVHLGTCILGYLGTCVLARHIVEGTLTLPGEEELTTWAPLATLHNMSRKLHKSGSGVWLHENRFWVP